MRAARLVDEFEIPGTLRFEDDAAGLARAVITTATAEAELYLQGAHLASWMPRGQRPVLFLSSKSMFATGKAIRGGVPIIFPWFGNRPHARPGPSHGFARTMEWGVEGTRLHDDGTVEIILTLSANDFTRGFFDAEFHLRYRVRVGSELELELETRNDGSQAITYEEALHTYFAVSDVRRVSVFGLADTTYIDKTDGFERKWLGIEPLRITKETDQVHLNTKATCLLNDPAWNRRIVIGKTGSDSTVIWNPWVEKTSGMSDMAAGNWTDMLCVETANAADNAVHLFPGARHKLAASIAVEQLEKQVAGR